MKPLICELIDDPYVDQYGCIQHRYIYRHNDAYSQKEDKEIVKYFINKYGKKWTLGWRVDPVKCAEYTEIEVNGFPKKEARVIDLSSVSEDLRVIIGEACLLPQAEQYKKGNEKALNSLVGWVLKYAKFDPAVIKELLIKELTNDNNGV